MASHVASLPPSLATNKFAITQAKKLDSKSNQLATLKKESGRPSRIQRGMSALAGAGTAGLICGQIENPAVKVAVTTAIGVVAGGLGMAMDSDMLVDAAIGCGSALAFKAGETASAAVKAGMTDDDDETEAEADPA